MPKTTAFRLRQIIANYCKNYAILGEESQKSAPVSLIHIKNELAQNQITNDLAAIVKYLMSKLFAQTDSIGEGKDMSFQFKLIMQTEVKCRRPKHSISEPEFTSPFIVPRASSVNKSIAAFFKTNYDAAC